MSEAGYFVNASSTGKWHIIVLVILEQLCILLLDGSQIVIGRYRVVKTSLILMWIGSMAYAFLDVLQMVDVAVPILA